MYGRDRWSDIVDLVNRWLRRFPEEYDQNLEWVRQEKLEYNMKRKERPMRKGLMVHPRLLLYVQEFHPDFMLSNEDVRTFAKKFPKFVVDEGVLPPKQR